MDRVLGTCSLCGGPVTVPPAWYGMLPPVPTCADCGARPKQPHGPVIKMEPRRDTSSVNNSCIPLSNTCIAAVIPDRAAGAMRWAEEHKALIRKA